MQRIRFRIVLPTILSFLAVALSTWDYENSRVLASMGMGWDTGPPIWPYRAVKLFSAVNVPAYVISWPVLKIPNLQTFELQYAVWFPIILAWWWWVGSDIDFGLLGHPGYSHPRLVAGILLAGSLFLLLLASHVAFEEYQWVRDYWQATHPFMRFFFLGP